LDERLDDEMIRECDINQVNPHIAKYHMNLNNAETIEDLKPKFSFLKKLKDKNMNSTYDQQHLANTFAMPNPSETLHVNKKVLFIGGGNANFTCVKKTFVSILKAIEQFSTNSNLFQETEVWIRRAGPN